MPEDVGDARDPLLVRDLVKNWLEDPVKTYRQSNEDLDLATWLLVFDDVNEPEIVDAFLPSRCFGSGAVLITSRNLILLNYTYSRTANR